MTDRPAAGRAAQGRYPPSRISGIENHRQVVTGGVRVHGADRHTEPGGRARNLGGVLVIEYLPGKGVVIEQAVAIAGVGIKIKADDHRLSRSSREYRCAHDEHQG